MCDPDEVVNVFRDDKRKRCPVYTLEEDPESSLFEQMVARAAETPKKYPMFILRPVKGSSLRRIRNMDTAVGLVPNELEVKSYQLIPNDKVRGLYELDMNIIKMSKVEYEEKSRAQYEGADYGYGLYPTQQLLKRFVKNQEGGNLAMLYAHDVSFSLMDQFDDIPAKYRLSSLNEASGFSSLLEDKVIDGVNCAMTYYSVAPSGSSWHEEDFGLASANWLMPGSDSKFWIGKVVERQTELIRPIRKAYRHICANPLSHKDYLFAYDYFAESKALHELYYAEQKAGDIVVSMVAASHQVWNPGRSVSLAEAVNVLFPWWTKEARRMFRCTCSVFQQKYYAHSEWIVLRNALYFEEKAYFVRRPPGVNRFLRNVPGYKPKQMCRVHCRKQRAAVPEKVVRHDVVPAKCAGQPKTASNAFNNVDDVDGCGYRGVACEGAAYEAPHKPLATSTGASNENKDPVVSSLGDAVPSTLKKEMVVSSVVDAEHFTTLLTAKVDYYEKYKQARHAAQKRYEAKRPKGSSTARKAQMDPFVRKIGSQHDAAKKQLSRLRRLLQERPYDAKLLSKLEKQDLRVRQITESRGLYHAIKAHYDRVVKDVRFSDLQREGYTAFSVVRDFWLSKSPAVRAYFAQLVKLYTPKSTKKDSSFAKFLTELSETEFRKTFQISKKVRVPCEDLVPNLSISLLS